MKKRNVLREILKKDSLVDKLFKQVDDYDIYSHFIGFEPELGETLHSPIRGGDEYPSFALFIPTRVDGVRPDAIWFKDLADSRFGDVLRFVKYFAMHHYGEDLDTLYRIVGFIDHHMELGILNGSASNWTKTAKNIDYESKRKPKEILYKSRRYTKRDLKYWRDYYIDIDTLKHFNVKSVRYLLTDAGAIRKEFRMNELAFIYPIWDKAKLYQPMSPKSFKFRNSCPGNDPRYYQGFNQLEGHKTLIITKSMKDVMVFWKVLREVGTPVDCLAPHAESINLTDKFVEAVQKKYERIIVVSDYDLAGVRFARKCRDQGFEYRFIDTNRTYINGKYKVIDKDISDFLCNNGVEETKKLLQKWKIE